MSNIESIGTIQAIYTVEPNPENENEAIVCYWLPTGQKIGELVMPKG